MTSLVIRTAVEADDEAIARTMQASWNDAYRGLVPDELSEELTVELRVQKRIARRAAPTEGRVSGEPERREWVAAYKEGDRIDGYVSCGPVRDPDFESPSQAEIYSLYVHPHAQGQRIGGRLLEHVLEDLSARGFIDVRLWVLTKNERAQRFYRDHGFRVDIEGDQKVLFGHVLEHDLLIRLLSKE